MRTRLVVAAPEVRRAFEETGSLEMVGRQCRLEPYSKLRVPSFRAGSDFIAFASPDSTWAVTEELFDQAKKSILIGIYDMTASYVKELLLKAMRRGVKVTLMLDLDGRTGEMPLFNELAHFGADCVPAPSCASKRIHCFSSSHEKVIVIDDEWTLVQSGNYSDNSIPQNEDGGDPTDWIPGNRDMGVAVKSRPLARFFSNVLRSDMKLELNAAAPEMAGLADLPVAEATQPAPPSVPPRTFASKRLNPKESVRILPVLTPDNYMDEVPEFLASASRSIRIEQQYIRGNQPMIKILLQGIRAAMEANSRLVVQIVLARPFPSKKTFEKEAKAIRELGHAFGLKLGTHVRILNPRYFVHCHNKLIVVDDQAVLVSSQNWSDSAVGANREAGLIIHYPDIARYFAGIFQLDWDTSLRTLRMPEPKLFGPEALSTGRVVPVNWGDYAEV